MLSYWMVWSFTQSSGSSWNAIGFGYILCTYFFSEIPIGRTDETKWVLRIGLLPFVISGSELFMVPAYDNARSQSNLRCCCSIERICEMRGFQLTQNWIVWKLLSPRGSLSFTSDMFESFFVSTGPGMTDGASERWESFLKQVNLLGIKSDWSAVKTVRTTWRDTPVATEEPCSNHCRFIGQPSEQNLGNERNTHTLKKNPSIIDWSAWL